MLRRFTMTVICLSGLLIGLLGTLQSNALAQARPKNGRVSVVIATPRGVPGNVTLVATNGSKRYVASKSSRATRKIVALTVRSETYSVRLTPVTFDGRQYTGTASKARIKVVAGRAITVRIRFRAVATARSLHANRVTKTSVSLVWSGPRHASYAVRRTIGSRPAATRGVGTAIRTNGTTALSSRLSPGTRYSFALFTRVGSVWTGPLTVVAGTAASVGTKTASFIANPGTVLGSSTQSMRATAIGGGVRVKLSRTVPTPVIGTPYVLPRSASLPGGYVGLVHAISRDGRTVSLSPAALADAFSYYDIRLDDISTNPEQLSPANARPDGMARSQSTPHSLLNKCPSIGGGGSKTVTYHPSLNLAGHFHHTLDTWTVLGAQVPKGASFDVEFAITVTGAASIETTGSLTCGLDFNPFVKQFSVGPVPMALSFTPSVEVNVEGSQKVSNLGTAVTAGLKFAGTMGVTSGASFSGSPILSATPLTPTYQKAGSISFKIGGQILFGPGVGTSKSGVIAGISGELDPLVASAGAAFPVGDDRRDGCLKFDAKAKLLVGLTAKAWLGNWSLSKTVTVPGLNGERHYLGAPWYFPSDCENAPDPNQDALGAGVTGVKEVLVGGNEQIGHVDGLAPGSSTWVLSTGKIGDVVGPPDQFISTNLSGPGDSDLTALVGFETYDAASFTTTVIPDGTTLHIRYVFASEEYPEYVGSRFNDVMLVDVNGVNCATVPGTNEPVAVNSVNEGTNSGYYVDNSAGASGYGTSMDGLTVPLTCSIPVTPGQPVTIKMAVADTSDGEYDTAVAVLDGGIWSD